MTSQTIPRPRVRVRSTHGTRGPRIVPLVFFTFLAIALFFAMIYLRIALDRSAFELDTLEDQISLEESRQLDLRLEIARLQDPLRISGEAQRIGLTHPEERLLLEVNAVRNTADPIETSPVSALTSGTRDEMTDE